MAKRRNLNHDLHQCQIKKEVMEIHMTTEKNGRKFGIGIQFLTK